jgi:sulfopropanediol 3-dehydrogenase
MNVANKKSVEERSRKYGVRYVKMPAKGDLKISAEIVDTVKHILESVEESGDRALIKLTKQYDHIELADFEVSTKDRVRALQDLDAQTQRDSEFAIERVRDFAQAQYESIKPLDYEPFPGLHLGHRVIPIETVGCYVPGGRYPILSAPIMTIIPAKVAGCGTVIACLPPGADPAMIAICQLAGADRIFRVGGAQAIAGMAFGTDTIPRVDKIVGPGNAYVNEAKRQIFGPVGIDQLAGPSEIFIVADETANPSILATDLLAQAEHDVRARVGLITTSQAIAEETLRQVDKLLQSLSTADVAGQAWRDYGEVVICENDTSMIAYANHIAAEHLQVHVKDPHDMASKLRNYGSLFIGEEASVVFSDKCCGTNHTLPTMGAGRYTGGLWVGDYVKICTHQWMDERGVAILAPPSIRQSYSEKMECHARAAEIRMKVEK